ncbi:hypothetical protein PRIPAC_97990 [Pristionchus pacificus]|uniref:Uncharacterized protein n=1 Tax=Pristionchus pacificus TaxID=54126 RepID=A0A2A6CH05_PRIPA|nr:hypothetical protein PRIPAC_97990 [Pristionchus pacificus]|eukprot:PDM77301.1 hypothetical protein PRIPAC_40251 [Pristionchus pacificus]
MVKGEAMEDFLLMSNLLSKFRENSIKEDNLTNEETEKKLMEELKMAPFDSFNETDDNSKAIAAYDSRMFEEYTLTD